jgi:hypothetical protein
MKNVLITLNPLAMCRRSPDSGARRIQLNRVYFETCSLRGC